MRKLVSHIFFFLALCFAESSFGQAVFEQHVGQWESTFAFRMPMNRGTAFIEDDGIRFHLTDRDLHSHGNSLKDEHHHQSGINTLGFKLQFVGSSTESLGGQRELDRPTHFIRGRDPARWKTNVPVFHGVLYKNLYPGIDADVSGKGKDLKYDFHLRPGADLNQLKYKFIGVESLNLKEGQLQIQTALGSLREYIPRAYQIIGDDTVEVDCAYFLYDDESIGFTLGEYDRKTSIIIDPILVFSSFSGSSADNWGFTATYDDQGNIYGGGISFGLGYPTTLGVIQNAYGGGVIDVAITKLNADGTQSLFATYIGGSGNDQPHSLVVDSQGNLIVLGITGSADLPLPALAYQSNFQGGTNFMQGAYGFSSGTDLFILKLSSDGTQLLAGTLFGGSLNDGVNELLAVNYADEFRGEVVVDGIDNIYIASVTLSADVPHQNAFQPAMGGLQDALVASFPSDLQGLNWSSYYGGSLMDNANSLKVAPDGSVYIVGGTGSLNLQVSGNSYGSSVFGSNDGYVLRLSSGNGSFLNASYIGSNASDQVYMVETDRYGSVYLLGQSFGIMPISAGVFSQSPGGQFIQKLSADLTSLEWSTVIGNGSVPNLSPTAFLVDNCLNIYVSGWGGITNSSNLGTMDNMPLSADAFQSNTDGSEFYFLVLEENVRALQFATYYGGQADEHVDGGTSRFSPDGTIYQAVCAGCGNRTFPTTPGVYGPNNNSTNCNLGVIKIDFESSIDAEAGIDLSFVPDTICDTLLLKFENNSFNANRYFWDFGNGQTSEDEAPVARFDTLGTYEITLIATDTLCNVSDTSRLQLTHSGGSQPEAAFFYEGILCNPDIPVRFESTSQDAQDFEWFFGDGQSSSGQIVQHAYGDFGTFEIELIARDTVCGSADTVRDVIIFEESSYNPVLEVAPPSCRDGSTLLQLLNTSDSIRVFWDFGDGDSAQGGTRIRHRFNETGWYNLHLDIFDTVCANAYVLDTLIYIEKRIDRLFIPNVFTPNGDGLNEAFVIAGDDCYRAAKLIIYNRWGEKMFETNRPLQEFWNGFQNGKAVPDGVYQWIFINGDLREHGTVTVLH